jgi:hypothetical protein
LNDSLGDGIHDKSAFPDKRARKMLEGAVIQSNMDGLHSSLEDSAVGVW